MPSAPPSILTDQNGATIGATMKGDAHIAATDDNKLLVMVTVAITPDGRPEKTFKFGFARPLEDGVHVIDQDVAFVFTGYAPVMRRLYVEIGVTGLELTVRSLRL